MRTSNDRWTSPDKRAASSTMRPFHPHRLWGALQFFNVTVKNFGGTIRAPPAAGMVGAKLMIYRYLVTFSPSYPQRYPRTYPLTHPTSLPGLGVAGRTLKAEWRTP